MSGLTREVFKMTLHGRIRNGVIVLDEPALLPEGAQVCVEIQPDAELGDETAVPADTRLEPISKRLLKFAGRAEGLPPDASRNHDHYLYGTPKR